MNIMNYNQEYAYSQRPNDYKTWSIINLVVSVVFCCSCAGIVSMVLSIIALMKSNEVNNMLQLGDNTGFLRAQEASNTAKTLNIISSVLLGIGVIGSIIYVLVVGVANITQSLNNF
jgi:hypothetical protein